ncbi:HNH endonuclease [Micromonospora sp. NPDC047762]|uniref:HNH endonuclease n=1 Tax=unclassified Micromonospora TaxID=2617518 RepID=UPI0033F953FF
MDAPMRESVRSEHKPEFCEWQGCTDPYYSRGLCQLHYMRKYKGTDMDAPTRSRPVPGVSTRTTKFGYVHVYLPDHPNAQHKGWVNQHRHVMEQELGRYLVRHENVHHKNGDRADNRPENLELWITAQPSGQRVEDRVAHARWLLSLYGSEREQQKYGDGAGNPLANARAHI